LGSTLYAAVLEISCVDVVEAFLDHFAVISGKHTQLGLSSLGLGFTGGIKPKPHNFYSSSIYILLAKLVPHGILFNFHSQLENLFGF